MGHPWTPCFTVILNYNTVSHVKQFLIFLLPREGGF